MNSNCSGREFLGYAREEFEQGNYEIAVYLGCVSELECSKIGDYEGIVDALNFTNKARKSFNKAVRTELLRYGMDTTKEVIKEFVMEHQNMVRLSLRSLLDEFNFKGELSDKLVSRVEEELNKVSA